MRGFGFIEKACPSRIQDRGHDRFTAICHLCRIPRNPVIKFPWLGKLWAADCMCGVGKVCIFTAAVWGNNTTSFTSLRLPIYYHNVV